MTNPISKLLDDLAELKAQFEIMQAEKRALIDKAVPPEVKAEIEGIEAEFKEQEKAASDVIARLEGEIAQAVIASGVTIKGNFIQAVFSDGRISWDTKKLTVLAKSLPEILNCMKQGEPSVSFRKVK